MMQESIKPALGLFAAKIWSENQTPKEGPAVGSAPRNVSGNYGSFPPRSAAAAALSSPL